MIRRPALFLVSLWLSAMAIGAQAADLVVYSGRSDKFVKPVVKAFTEETGIKVTIHSGSSTALLNKLKLEGARTAADIYISNDAGNLQRGAELELFHPVNADAAKAIPQNYRAADNSWVGLSARARVLVVNKNDKQAMAATSVFDLADEKFKNKLGITHSSNESYIAGATVYMRVAGIDKTRAWLKGMKENVDGSVFNKHSKIVKAVAEGKKSIGLVNHYYIFRYLAKKPDAPIKLILPDQGKDGMGVAWNVAGAAITKHSKNKDAAQAFMAYMISQKGQQQFAKVNREYPTRPGVPAAKAVPALSSYKVADVPMSDLGKYRNATIDLIESVGMP